MFALKLVTRFSDLLNNKVVGVAFRHSFDSRLLMSRHDNEAREMRRHPVVLSRRKFDRFEARFGRALAMERKHLLDAMLFCAFLDPLIDRTKDFLVTGGRIRKIHRHIIPQAKEGGLALRTLLPPGSQRDKRAAEAMPGAAAAPRST